MILAETRATRISSRAIKNSSDNNRIDTIGSIDLVLELLY